MNLKSIKNVILFICLATFTSNNVSPISVNNYGNCRDCDPGCYLIKLLWVERCVCTDIK